MTSGKATIVEEVPTSLSKVKISQRRRNKGTKQEAKKEKMTDINTKEVRKKMMAEVDITCKMKMMMTRNS